MYNASSDVVGQLIVSAYGQTNGCWLITRVFIFACSSISVWAINDAN